LRGADRVYARLSSFERKGSNVRAAILIVGVALVITGVVWIFQGIGVLEGSFMTGSSFWAWIGALAVMVGLPLIVRGWRRS
jgi:hypothetical protein